MLLEQDAQGGPLDDPEELSPVLPGAKYFRDRSLTLSGRKCVSLEHKFRRAPGPDTTAVPNGGCRVQIPSRARPRFSRVRRKRTEIGPNIPNLDGCSDGDGEYIFVFK